MLESYNISRINILVDIFWLLLAIIDNLPLVKVLWAVCFQLLEKLIWILSPLWRSWPVLRRIRLYLNLVVQVILRHMQVAVVFLIVEQDMVVEDNSLTIKTVLVSLLDIKSHSLGRGVVHQLDQLALSIALGWLFGMLDEHLRILVPQLDWGSVGHLLSKLELDPLFVVCILLIDPFLEHLELVLKSNTLNSS